MGLEARLVVDWTDHVWTEVSIVESFVPVFDQVTTDRLPFTMGSGSCLKFARLSPVDQELPEGAAGDAARLSSASRVRWH